MYVLGISQHHDSAAALTYRDRIVAFIEEERLTRVKHDGAFPVRAIRHCLDAAGITLGDVDHVAFYWQAHRQAKYALGHFVRHLPDTLEVFRNGVGYHFRGLSPEGETETYHAGSALVSNLRLAATFGRHLRNVLGYRGPVKYKINLMDHHRSHAASTYFLSPFDEAAIITWDGIGSDGVCTYLGVGKGNQIHDVRRVKFPHSLGELYSCVTGYLGFTPTRDEGKVMGLAAYGTPRYVQDFEDLVRLGPDGQYELDLAWFRHHMAGRHEVSQRFIERFGPPRPNVREAVPQHYADIAFALQATLEKVGLHVASWLQKETGQTNLATAGGVALNSVMNGRILLETPFEEFYAQAAASDDGSALGAALLVSVEKFGHSRPSGEQIFLGPEFSEDEMEKALAGAGLSYTRSDDVIDTTAQALDEGKIVGWFQGRMEVGPRALGNRSILADPRCGDAKDRLNEKVKHREPFRPFAPSCLAGRAGEYFASGYPSPVMLLVFDVLEHQRDKVPAITHEDGTARVQTVSASDNPRYHALISRFEELTGVPMVVNTSFNDNEEPIVCTPEDAVRCYLKTGMDALALGPFWVEKEDS